jgi:MFS family permease
MMSTLVVGPFYLSQSLHLSTVLVGFVMTVGPIASIISGVPAGRAVDKIGPARVIIMGLGLIITGSFSFAVLPSRLGVAGYVISAALLSPGYQMFQAGNNSTVMLEVPEHQKGMISGILSLSRNSGLIIGASGMGMIYSNFGMERTFLVATFIAVAPILLASGKVKFQRRTI